MECVGQKKKWSGEEVELGGKRRGSAQPGIRRTATRLQAAVLSKRTDADGWKSELPMPSGNIAKSNKLAVLCCAV